METKAQAAVARRIEEVEPGSFRQHVLLAAQKFKNSWVELGALLVKVRSEGLYEQWGFATFEAYCSSELRIKKQTALKLTNSYAFLARHERAAVEPRAPDAELEAANEPKPLPSFEVISVLAGAEERGQLNEQDYRSMREQIWSEEKPAAAVARELAQRFPAPKPPPPPADLILKRLAHQARKLANDLKECRKVPDAVAERAAALAEDVEELASSERSDH